MLFLKKQISVLGENKANLKIVYCVFESSFDTFCSYSFSVEILNSKHKDDKIFIKGVTDCPKIAKDIFKKLVNFSVTPSTLINILDDHFNEI